MFLVKAHGIALVSLQLDVRTKATCHFVMVIHIFSQAEGLISTVA